MIVALPLQLLGLPGTWLLVAGAFLFRWLQGPDLIDYHTIIILGLMALLAEALELLTAVQGARSGPSVRGAAVASIVVWVPLPGDSPGRLYCLASGPYPEWLLVPGWRSLLWLLPAVPQSVQHTGPLWGP